MTAAFCAILFTLDRVRVAALALSLIVLLKAAWIILAQG